MEFLAKFYWANFFSWAENAKYRGYTKNGTGPAREAGWADRPRGPGGGSPRFFPGMCLFDFLLWSENF
jgi:hypothetical protein